jgi:hypothetical protein
LALKFSGLYRLAADACACTYTDIEDDAHDEPGEQSDPEEELPVVSVAAGTKKRKRVQISQNASKKKGSRLLRASVSSALTHHQLLDTVQQRTQADPLGY